MKKLLIFLLLLTMLPSAKTQDKEPLADTIKKVKQFNLVKIGSSIQGDIYMGYDYYDPYYGSYSYYDQSPDGYNATLFAAYEHIWEFPNKIAIGIEPKAGVSFRKHLTNVFIGNDIKFYWVSKDIWRMGIALSADYYYGRNETDIILRMEDGHYYQRVSANLNNHFLNFDMALIPFQLKLRSIPLLFELQFSMIGIGIYYNKTESIDYPDGSNATYSGSQVYPYLFKTEFKIGFQLP